MDVAVIGRGNPAITAVNDLAKYARKIRKGSGELSAYHYLIES
jgi:thioredoxin reductase